MGNEKGGERRNGGTEMTQTDHKKSSEEGFLSGFVAIIGPPNVGKSTLLNRLLGTKVAIVSPKPQTTRNRILGIYHGDGYQMVFMDTPGIHKTRTALHKSMVGSAQEAIHEVDIILLMIEMSGPEAPDIPLILSNLDRAKKPSLLAINKIDTGPKEDLLPIMEALSQRHPFEAIIPISALNGDGIERLVEELKSRLKPGPPSWSLRSYGKRSISMRGRNCPTPRRSRWKPWKRIGRRV
jgi:GTP-binding protein Era